MRPTPLSTGAVLACLLVSLLFQCGCRRNSRRSADPPPPEATAPATPANAVSTPGQTTAQPSPASPAQVQVPRIVEELNYALQDYRERTGKMPKSLEELFAASKLPRPQLPPGAQLRLNERYKIVELVPPGSP